MKITIRKPSTFNIRYLKINAFVRHWVDCDYSTDNGETWHGDFEDIMEEHNRIGKIIPGSDGEHWKITIDLWNGRVLNWPKGFCLKTHFKVCDEGEYEFLDVDGKDVINITEEFDQYYVPDFLSIEDDGWGDYIIININGDGTIENFDIMEERIKTYFNEVED